jgi:pimeloyl-ACP methyl ester carboxylesterase
VWYAHGMWRAPKWAVALAVVVLPLPALVVAVRAYRTEKNLFFPARAPLKVAAGAAGLPGLVEVEWGAPVVKGWFVAPRNGATVILVHGAGADRSQMLPEARLLVEHGFGVLLFDLPGHGESEGSVHWSEGERHALAGALDWLGGRREVDGGRVGALGFSMGGYVLAQVAMHDQRLRAVALAGTPPDVAAQSQWQFRRFHQLTQLPARLALLRGGIHLDEPQPAVAVAGISPRPLLLVAGTEDPTVPLPLARQLHAAAREPKDVLVIDGAGHGGYDQTAPDAYRARVLEFFTRALAAQGSGTGLAK